MYSDDSGGTGGAGSEARPALRRLRAALASEGAVQLGAWMLQGNPLIANVIASTGVTWVGLDTQHGLFDPATLANCVSIFQAAGIPCLVRVSSNDPHAIGWALDAGADGVIVPMVESAADARKALEAARYPPLGQRSVGPFAAAARGLRFSATGDHPLCLVMIETAKGVKACREIAAVEGLDGIFVGPGDLAVSLGLEPSLGADDEASVAAIRRVSRAGQERGLILGVFAGHGASSERWTQDGFGLLGITTDLASLRTGITNELKATVTRPVTGRNAGSNQTEKGNAMIDLHFFPTPNGHEASIMLEEVGLPYALHPVNIMAGEQFRSEYLEINPNNKIPAIVDHDGPDGKSHAVFETGAILIYLAEKTGKLLPSDPAARSRALQWLMFQTSNVGPNFGQLAFFQSLAEKKVPYAIERFKSETARIYGVLERQLAKEAYLAGADYSIADIALFPWMGEVMRGMQAFDWTPFPHVQRWYTGISARAGVQRGLAVAAA